MEDLSDVATTQFFSRSPSPPLISPSGGVTVFTLPTQNATFPGNASATPSTRWARSARSQGFVPSLPRWTNRSNQSWDTILTKIMKFCRLRIALADEKGNSLMRYVLPFEAIRAYMVSPLCGECVLGANLASTPTSTSRVQASLGHEAIESDELAMHPALVAHLHNMQ